MKARFMISSMLSVGIMAVALPSTSMADMINPSFEDGLTGWTVQGEVYDVYTTTSYTGVGGSTYTAPWEENFAVVKAGCHTNKLLQEFSAKEGDVLLGWSFFKAGDYMPYDDEGEVKLVIKSDGTEVVMFASKVSEVGNYGGTDWIPWEFTAPADGMYSIQAISTNKDDCGYDSAVGLDLAATGKGFVTGGGWIDSPAGAMKSAPDLTGKANFGFVSKYKKGANKPTGNTQFHFQAGDLNFHSDTYDWLIVNKAGRNAQFKGTGSVNGDENFGFMLWASDYRNSPDTFRIKIWNMENDETVYDNGVKQSLGGGDIVVRTGKK